MFYSANLKSDSEQNKGTSKKNAQNLFKSKSYEISALKTKKCLIQ